MRVAPAVAGGAWRLQSAVVVPHARRQKCFERHLFPPHEPRARRWPSRSISNTPTTPAAVVSSMAVRCSPRNGPPKTRATRQGVKPGCEFHRRLRGNEIDMDLAEAERDVVAASRSLRTLVTECTNMPPCSDAVARATGRVVVDIETLWIDTGRTRSASGA